jgi:hypothetical protein
LFEWAAEYSIERVWLHGRPVSTAPVAKRTVSVMARQ